MTKNKCSNTVNAAEGIFIGGSPTTGMVAKNTVENASDSGVELASTAAGITITNNTAVQLLLEHAGGVVAARQAEVESA